MKTNYNYIVYGLLDTNNKPFYIGKTNDIKRRKRRHLNDTKGISNLPVHNKIRKLLKLGFELNIKIIENNISEDKINKKEIEYIKKFKKDGCRLYNITEGGDGFDSKGGKQANSLRKNTKHSLKTRKKMSVAREGIKFTKQHIKSLKRNHKGMSGKTQSSKAKGLIGLKNRKNYIIKTYNGDKFEINGLQAFCDKINVIKLTFVRRSKRKLFTKGYKLCI